MKTIALSRRLILFVPVMLLLVSCTPRAGLNTIGALGSELQGTYRVIYYGCNYFNDFETVAFLDKEGDGYTFEPYAPAFNFRVATGVPAKEALAKAEHFVNCNTGFSYAQLRGIPSPEGDILGYELQPIYQPYVYGGGEALSTGYRLEDGKVVIFTRPAAWVERMLSGGDGHGRDK